MDQRKVTAVVLSSMVLSASVMMVAGTASARARSASSGVVLSNGSELPIGGDGWATDAESYSINGVLEYRTAPGRQFSPTPSSSYPRPSEVVADWFLRSNRLALGILQDPDDFQRISTEVRCDGTEVVTFQQYYNFTPVETSYVRLTIREQIVRYVEARFVAESYRLPVCQPSLPVSRPPRDMRYLPTGTNTVVVVTTIDQLTHGRNETIWDACTNTPIGNTTIYR